MFSAYRSMQWVEANKQKEEGVFTNYKYASELGVIEYNFFKREAGIIDGIKYYDIASYRGAEGPYINSVSEGFERPMIYDFIKKFESFCKKEKIIAEFAKLDPWDKYAVDIRECYGAEYYGNYYCNDLTRDFYSASMSIHKVYDNETLDLLFNKQQGLMIQEFLNGQEIGADVYIDLISGEVVSIFTKRKIKMRAGETDKAVSFKDQRLFAYITRFVKEVGFKGQIDIDIFDVNGKFYISEVNPRFGGGYPHAYECGVDHMKLIINNLKQIANKNEIGNYEEGKYMLKYSDVLLI